MKRGEITIMQLKLLLAYYSTLEDRKRQLFRDSSESSDSSNSAFKSLDSSPERYRIVIYWCLVTFNHKQRFSEKISRKNLYNKSHGRCTVTINGKIQEVKLNWLFVKFKVNPTFERMYWLQL